MRAQKPGDLTAIEAYATALGLVVANLQSLEFVLRLFLYKRRSAPHRAFRRGQNLTGLSVGVSLPENAVTDYDTLGKLIKRYNREVQRRFPARYEINVDVVALRDALAHGRVFIPKTGLPLQLLKFTKPRDGSVRITFAATLTLEWLQTQNGRVGEAIERVTAALRATRPPRTPSRIRHA